MRTIRIVKDIAIPMGIILKRDLLIKCSCVRSTCLDSRLIEGDGIEDGELCIFTGDVSETLPKDSWECIVETR